MCPVNPPAHFTPSARKPPVFAGGRLCTAASDQRFTKKVIAGLFAVTLEVTSPRKAMV